MSAAPNHKKSEMEIVRLAPDPADDEDSAYAAETKVGEAAYQAIAQLMSAQGPDPVSTARVQEPKATESGVRPALRDGASIPNVADNDVSLEPTNVIETKWLAALMGGDARRDPAPNAPSAPAPAMHVDAQPLGHAVIPSHAVNAAPVTITILEQNDHAPVPTAALPARRRILSLEVLVFCIAFAAAIVPFLTYFFFHRL